MKISILRRDWRTYAAAAAASATLALTAVTMTGSAGGSAASGTSVGTVGYSTNATHIGGCNPHIKVAGFDIGVCIDDRGTAKTANPTAYPDIWVNTAGNTAHCGINISVWDNANHRLSATEVGCAGGHINYTGVATPAAGRTVHTFARLDYAGQKPISIGDSPSITLGPGAPADNVVCARGTVSQSSRTVSVHAGQTVDVDVTAGSIERITVTDQFGGGGQVSLLAGRSYTFHLGAFGTVPLSWRITVGSSAPDPRNPAPAGYVIRSSQCH